MNSKPASTVMGVVLAISAATAVAAPDANSESSKRPDLWLEARIVTTYSLNQHLNPFQLDVEVDDGVVTLAGTVDNPAERDLAVEIAKGVEGVNDVEDNIRVRPESPNAENPDMGTEDGRNFSRKVQDATTTASVKMRLFWNRNTEGLSIDVDTSNGVVALAGTVESGTKRDLAERIALNTEGVKSVDNRIRVDANAPTVGQKVGGNVGQTIDATTRTVSDAWITTKVLGSIGFSSEVNGEDINVSTDGKVVTLSGTVADERQQQRAVEIASEVAGVKSVRDRLKLKQRRS